MKVGDIFVSLGIKADTTQVQKINTGFKSLRASITEVTVAFTASVYALDRFVAGSVQAVASLQNINQQTGLSIELLQKWQNVGTLSNLALSADQISTSIAGLQKNLAAIAMGQGNIAPFQLLGIDATGKDAFAVLEELRKNIKGLNPAVATNLISQLGLDPAMISMLRLSNEEFDRLGKQYFLGKGSREAILGVGLAIKNLKLHFQNLKDQAVAKLAPILTRMIDSTLKWLAKNGGKITDTIKSIVGAFSAFVNIISRSVALLSDFAESAFKVKNGLKVIAASIGLLMLSFRPLIFTLTLIGLLLEDIWVFKKGGKSAIGLLIEMFEKLDQKMGDPFKKLKDGFKEAFGLDEETKKNMGIIATILDKLENIAKFTAAGAIAGYLTPVPGGTAVGATAGLLAGTFNELLLNLVPDANSKMVKHIGGKLVSEEEFQDAKRRQRSERALPGNIEKSHLISPKTGSVVINNNTQIQTDDPKVWADQTKRNANDFGDIITNQYSAGY